MTDTTLEKKPTRLEMPTSSEKPASLNTECKDEGGDVFLLEDIPSGKILYIQHGLANFYFFCELSFGVWLGLQLPLWIISLILIPQAVLYLFLSTSGYYSDLCRMGTAPISGSVLIHLLKEVQLQSSRSSNLDWRQIAYSVNEYAWEMQSSDPVFFSGDHCKNYFEYYIVGAVQDESYQVTLECAGPNFGGKNSHRDFLDRSVQSYQSMAEVYQKA